MVKKLNCSSTARPIEAWATSQQKAPSDPELPRRQRPGACPLHSAVDVAVDDVVVGASGATHGEGADEEQPEMQKIGQGAPLRHRGQAADHQQGQSSSHPPIGRSARDSLR